ncbi:proteasome subunit beta [Candidatus Geothermarchaeota archaeon]|nr:MAG: proteasome subunit beta [Candidatus Geothermarchaeota archaeon]
MGYQAIPGATAIGVVFKDGIILAAEKRMSYGGFITAKTVKKVFKISDRVGAACAGGVADIQEIIRRVRYILRLKELETGARPSVVSVAKLTSIMLFQNRLFPLMAQIIIGGCVDRPQIFSLDPLGSLVEDKYIAIGSGEEIAMGVLESGYKKDMSKEGARELVLKSIRAAIGRDAASGDGVDMLMITKDEIREESISF